MPLELSENNLLIAMKGSLEPVSGEGDTCFNIIYPGQSMRILFFTDTTDTVLHRTPANKGNYRNCGRRSDSFVTHLNAGYYHGSVGITAR